LGEAKKIMGNYYYKNVIEIKDIEVDLDDDDTIDQYVSPLDRL